MNMTARVIVVMSVCIHPVDCPLWSTASKDAKGGRMVRSSVDSADIVSLDVRLFGSSEHWKRCKAVGDKLQIPASCEIRVSVTNDAPLKRLKEKEVVSVTYQAQSYPTLDGIGAFLRLRELDLSSCNIDDNVLENIGRCSQLETLHLTHSGVSNSDLAVLHSLSHLRNSTC